MPIYWTLKSVPELSHLSRQERGLAWQRVGLKTLRHWQAWLGLIVCAGCAGMGSYLGTLVGYSTVGAAVGGCIGGFISSQACIHVARLHYREILMGR